MNVGKYVNKVATAPTVYGIETMSSFTYPVRPFAVATAPTVYGIETLLSHPQICQNKVATAPTVYGIETHIQR